MSTLPDFKCGKCGCKMRRAVHDDNVRHCDAVGLGPERRLIYHLCGACKTVHKVIGDVLIPLTQAEMFELEMMSPGLVDASKALVPGLTIGTFEPPRKF